MDLDLESEIFFASDSEGNKMYDETEIEFLNNSAEKVASWNDGKLTREAQIRGPINMAVLYPYHNILK